MKGHSIWSYKNIWKERDYFYLFIYLLKRWFILTVTVQFQVRKWVRQQDEIKTTTTTTANSHGQYNKFHLQKIIWDVSKTLHFLFVKLPKFFLFYSFLLSSASGHKLVTLFSINNSVLRYIYIFSLQLGTMSLKMTVVKLEVLFSAQFIF